MVRPIIDGTDYFDVFRDMDFIATKVPGIEVDIEGSSTNFEGKSEKEIRTILSQPPYNLTGRLLGNTVPQLDRFVNGMSEGDLVLVPDGDTVHFASIESKYCHSSTFRIDHVTYETLATIGEKNEPFIEQRQHKELSLWLPHWRQVRWLTSTPRDSLSSDLRKLLMNRRQIGDLSKFYNEIAPLSRGEDVGAKTLPIHITYPLRDDFEVKINLNVPSDLTYTEAKRLGRVVENTFFHGDFDS